MLIDYGADLNLKNKQGESFFQVAEESLCCHVKGKVENAGGS